MKYILTVALLLALSGCATKIIGKNCHNATDTIYFVCEPVE